VPDVSMPESDTLIDDVVVDDVEGANVRVIVRMSWMFDDDHEELTVVWIFTSAVEEKSPDAAKLLEESVVEYFVQT
jgi:hypothetical protein